MMTLTITLEDELEQRVRRFADRFALTPQEAAIELLQRSAGLQKIRELRKKGRKYAEQAGIEGEEDLSEAVREWRTENPDTDQPRARVGR